MLTKLLVIQKIEEDGSVNIHQAYSDNFQWTFETDRISTNEDKDYFPFTIAGDVNVEKRKPGPETKTKIDGNIINFIDDYGIPDGSVIAILPPSNLIPDIIKFKDKPYIPTGLIGQVVSSPPGQIQIVYNHSEKKSAIILHIHEKQFFGIKCAFKKVSDEEFPENNDVWQDELFDISISRELLNIESIKTEDLEIFNETINIVDLTEVNQILNEILEALKNNDKAKAQNTLSKFGRYLMTSTQIGGNIGKIIESLDNGGAVNNFIKQVIKYTTT